MTRRSTRRHATCATSLFAAAVAVAFALTAVPAAAAPPANDNFAAAQPVGIPDTPFGTNVEATIEGGEPAHGGFSGGHSVWYRFFSSANTRLKVNTCATGLDTVLAVYTGGAVDALTPVASNDNACGVASEVIFDAAPSTSYYIAVDGAAGATGAFELLVTLAPRPVPQPTCPPAGTPADEPVYRGTHAQGGMVCLTLTPDFTGVTGWFALDTRDATSGSGCRWPVIELRFLVPLPIDSDRGFNANPAPTWGPANTIRGSFPTEQTASGTLAAGGTFGFVGAGAPSSCSSGGLTWTATTESRFAFPPPPPPPDTRPPGLRLAGATFQRALRRGFVAVNAACPQEDCALQATGTITIPRRRALRLRSATRVLAGGVRTELRLGLPQTARRPIGAALRAGRTVTAKLTVGAFDAAGNRTTLRRTIRLRR